MNLLYFICLCLVSHMASADVCKLDVSATDQMHFEQQSLQVESQCTEVEVTLHNSGKLPANVMGHDWVLTKTSDVSSVSNAGMGAGLANNYQKPGDKRILAATRIIGGGEKTTVTFSMSQLQTGTSYTYFCSVPGHISVMKGRLVLNAVSSGAVAKNEAE